MPRRRRRSRSSSGRTMEPEPEPEPAPAPALALALALAPYFCFGGNVAAHAIPRSTHAARRPSSSTSARGIAT
jgi:hypothetical protein